jgi:3-oxoacyl-[acyl-carrier protein] reductase
LNGLEGRTALITGASRGIGAATAVAFAEAGANVAINYHSSHDRAAGVAERARSFGRRAELYAADIRSFDDCKGMVESALADFGKIDILVNNAGIGYETHGTPLVADIDAEALQDYLNYNVFGALNLIKLLVPQMRQLERVAPGLVDTDMGDGALSSTGALADQSKQQYAENAPFGFICQPEDVAGAIIYLCSASGRYVTNQRIAVNGGGF